MMLNANGAEPSGRLRSSPGQFFAILGGGFPRNSAENTVEVAQRLEAGGKGNLADPQVGIQQKIFRFFHAHA